MSGTNFKKMLNKLTENEKIAYGEDKSARNDLKYHIYMNEPMEIADIDKLLGLSWKVSLTNLVCFDSLNHIRKYDNIY